MAMKVTVRKKGKSADRISNSFLYRGVRITRTWTKSKRHNEIGEAMQKVLQRGPARASSD
jgi:hypothetical protein